MYDKIFDVRTYIYAIGLIVCSAAERFLTVFLNKGLQLDPESWHYHALSLGILVGLFIIANIAMKPIAHLDFITRMAFGKYHIGGRWVEVVINQDNQISHITKMDIVYEGNDPKLHGDCYVNNQYAYSFYSKCSSWDNFELTYLFEAREGQKGIREETGHLRFEPNINRKLDKYSGHFADKDMEFRVAAILIEDKKMVRDMDSDFIDTVRESVLPKLVEKHKLPKKILEGETSMKHGVTTIYDEEAIAARVAEIAAQITKDFEGETLTCVCVLKGAFIFLSDLLKRIDLPTDIKYIIASSYDGQTVSSGDVGIELDEADNIMGKKVLLIDDIADTGLTIERLQSLLLKRNPQVLKTCVLIDRPDRRTSSIVLDYVGFTISDKYLVGYGLDFAEHYRNLPYIGALEGV